MLGFHYPLIAFSSDIDGVRWANIRTSAAPDTGGRNIIPGRIDAGLDSPADKAEKNMP
jgi:hypothetical protein